MMNKQLRNITTCFICGKDTFIQHRILWDNLISAWGLTQNEVRTINRQQGYCCESCGVNLRSQTLAKSIMWCYGFNGLLPDFVKKYRKKIRVLEVNEAGMLHPYLQDFKNITLTSYPTIDIHDLPYNPDSFDLVVHSDTLEHVHNPVLAIEQCRKVLKTGGFMCYTVPAVLSRLTKHASQDHKSYHGTEGNNEYLVFTEYGSDLWTQVIEAGFDACTVVSEDYPASTALVARK